MKRIALIIGTLILGSMFAYSQVSTSTNDLQSEEVNSDSFGFSFGFDETEFKAYPNPATSQISLAFSTPYYHYSSLNIYDSNGRLFKKVEHVNQNDPIDISGLPAGMYHLELVNNEARSYTKLVKN